MQSRNVLILAIFMGIALFSRITSAQIFTNCTEITVPVTNIFCTATNQNDFPSRSAPGTIVSTNIQIFTISNQGFSNITDNAFSGLTISNLIFNTNSLQTIGANAFNGTTSITTLSFQEPTLATIESAAFTPIASSLTSLSFINSGITTSRMSTLATGLQTLSSTTSLTLNSNSLINIASGWLTGLTGLQTLTAQSNQIAGVDSTAFSTNTALKTIDLTSNQISDMSALLTAVTPLGSILETLTLASNSISTVTAFPSMTALRTLDLSNNRITTLAATTVLANAAGLTNIVLNNNSLTTPPEITNQLNLIVLNMDNQNSQLTTIADNAFSRSSTPTVGAQINLDNNAITSFGTKSFCSSANSFYSRVDITYDSALNFDKCLFKQLKPANAANTVQFVVVANSSVNDTSSFCNCENKVFATNNQVTLAGVCASFTDACSTTVYNDNCTTDFTCTRSSGSKLRFEYLGLILLNAVFLITLKQF